MEPVSGLTPNSDGDEDKKCLMALSVTELISILRTAYRTVDFDRVEEVLVDKESKLKSDIGVLSEKLKMERLERMNVEEKLKKYKEQFEKGKKAEERYEKLLQAVKKNSDLGDGNTVTELRNKNRKLEDEKRRAESETESWKRKCEELNERLLTVEKGAKSSMNGYVEIRATAEDISGARRNTDQGVSTEALDEMELNEVVKGAVDSGNTPVDSSPSQRETEFVSLASDDADNAQLETEDGHDDRSIQQKYNKHSRRRGSHNEVQDSSGKSFWCNMPEGQEVAKINKRNRGKQTIHNTGGLKNQASKKGKMDAQHQRHINGNERASPTVQTKVVIALCSPMANQRALNIEPCPKEWGVLNEEVQQLHRSQVA
ncbi:hypothetical protein QN277_016186 [Acacia crassicarpa]|uniref:Uncharacterized protein n=1 Tax=Acacia crassicarpa TaxID=499986 RepID=A0AAE1MW34_9FABA|nr:hypothetical protein QN277_016186 [Acacia crassicarpa]